MRARWILFMVILGLVGTGFYTGTHIASVTGNVVSEAYTVFDMVDVDSGTRVRILGLAGGTNEVRVTLEVEDSALQAHAVTLSLHLVVEGEEVGQRTEEVFVPYAEKKTTVISVPASLVSGQDVLVRIEGTDQFGTFRIEGMTTIAVTSPPDFTLWWGFGGFFLLLLLIFLLVRHSLTRASVTRFAQAHSGGLISLR